MKRGKKYRAAAEKLEKNKVYTIEEAVRFIKENKTAKFDESVEVHIRTNIDPKKGDQQVRGTLVLPHGTGKEKKVAVITSLGETEAKEAGADLVGGEELIEGIKNGKIIPNVQFDVLVATPEIMMKLAAVAKILGPKGLMPNPKSETVTAKVKETVAALKKGKIAFKNDDSGNVHQVAGKVSFEAEQLVENIRTFIEYIEKSKPSAFKGKLIVGVSICSTMGPVVKIQR